ncbi:hypothetical protein CKO31_02780 [Thiohalocapsa halophila]|uniref:Uncharacterized protein n=1 Tax=Thiohalocapsa halophila TaxID=69359 RepID=A0ABS1CDV9_9GAMM|nr:hypothetical protein [Thiohalocapsa halophila]MBK1629679.1 hypothetical protein [Thiohalocapsa halophila]
MSKSEQLQQVDQQVPAPAADRRWFLTRVSQAALAVFVAGAVVGCGEMDDDDDDEDEDDDD